MNRLKYPAQLADMLDLTAGYAKLVRDEIGAGRVLRHYRTPGLLNGDLWLPLVREYGVLPPGIRRT